MRTSRALVILFAAGVALLSSSLLAAQGIDQKDDATASAQSASSQDSTQSDSATAAAQNSSAPDMATSGDAQTQTQSGKAQAPSQGSSARTPPQNPVAPAKNKIAPPEDKPKQNTMPNPYGLSSLQDLYTQVPSAGGTLQRFGSDVFSTGTGNANQLPMDLPVGPDYVLGAGDQVVVNMWGGHVGRLTITIDRQGQITLPEVGTITLDRLTIAQAQAAIEKILDTQFRDEHVELSLGRLRTVRIYVVGDVQLPGAYDVSSLSTPLSALFTAGGPTSRGSLRILLHYRGEQLIRTIDLYDFLLRSASVDNDRLLPGDTISVPTVGPQVKVEGMVHRPAIYELNGETTLTQVLDLAGGVLPTGSLKEINVTRVVAHESRTMLRLELPSNPVELAQKLADFKVQGEDDIVISQILPYNQSAVYLEGHVYRPGRYPFHDGMTINDILHSYQDVMPESADHAELVRLEPPNYQPKATSFNLHDAMIGNDSFQLKPFDLIHIYGRYEIDAPKVSIEGEVLRPGEFPMPQGMTVADLVRLAGGFKRSAYQDDADLSSYTVQNGQKVVVSHSVIALKKALDGDKDADAVLKPGDVVSIRRLSGWQDIGASVTISGEVAHAGSYGIEDGERLSSVLKRAGGFRADAYPAAAVLERTQVRELNQVARQQMIRRIETEPIVVNAGPTSGTQTQDLQKSLDSQRQQILTNLRNQSVSGRLVINISTDIGSWENTPADIELRAGDTLVIPKRPNFVAVSGQVYNPIAVSYIPGKNLGWYLRKSGGATRSGNKKEVYVLRADGSIVPLGNRWISDNYMDLRMRPGDTIFIPEKIIGTSQVWQNILGAAQVASAATLPILLSGIL
jgi:protein involved in polysaccharide export with SLBB domain